MKKIISLLLLISISIIGLSSCKKEKISAPTCDEVIEAYEKAGYHVSHFKNEFKDDSFDDICYVKVWLDDEYENVYFYFYESAEAAETFDREREYHVLIFLFTVIYGDPTWVWTKTYGNIEYEYEDPRMIKPFKELTK